MALSFSSAWCNTEVTGTPYWPPRAVGSWAIGGFGGAAGGATELRADVPFFTAQEESSTKTQFVMSITGEVGFRFGG